MFPVSGFQFISFPNVNITYDLFIHLQLYLSFACTFKWNYLTNTCVWKYIHNTQVNMQSSRPEPLEHPIIGIAQWGVPRASGPGYNNPAELTRTDNGLPTLTPPLLTCINAKVWGRATSSGQSPLITVLTTLASIGFPQANYLTSLSLYLHFPFYVTFISYLVVPRLEFLSYSGVNV